MKKPNALLVLMITLISGISIPHANAAGKPDWAGGVELPQAAQDKIPANVLNKINAGKKQDVLVLFNDKEIQAKANAARSAARLKHENKEILGLKVAQYATLKKGGLKSVKPFGIELIQDYSHLPMAFVRVKNVNALNALAKNNGVVRIFENVEHHAVLNQSLPLIGQPSVNASANGAGATVAVLDTGADYTKPAFGSCTSPGVPAGCRVVYAEDVAPDDGVLDSSSGHGTNVAATVAGVAQGVDIIALDVFNSNGTASSIDVIDAINWVIQNKETYNIVAMNLSLGVERVAILQV